MGGAWLSLYAWDHYAFTLDKAFLRTAPGPSSTMPPSSSSTTLSMTAGAPGHRTLAVAGEQIPSAGRHRAFAHHGPDDGYRDRARTVYAHARQRASSGRGPGLPQAGGRRARQASAVQGWQARPVAGVAAGLRRERPRASPHLASLGALSRHADLAGETPSLPAPHESPWNAGSPTAEARQAGRVHGSSTTGTTCTMASRPTTACRSCSGNRPFRT